MSRILLIVLSETRAHELTFNNIKKNVIDELNADLCLCIGVKPDYDYDNPFYKLAKYKFLYEEPEDFGDAFEYAYNLLSKDKPKYEKLQNINSLYSLLPNPKSSTSNIKYYGEFPDSKHLNLDTFNDDEIVLHTKDFPDNLWKNQLYGIKKSNNNNFINQGNIITFKKPLYWREFLKIKDLIFGGVKDDKFKHNGSAGILIFFRWFLLKNLIDNDLINQYDRFIITRSDYIFQLPHPKLEDMDEKFIWIPNSEHYGGYTGRHVILSKTNIEKYLNIFNNFVFRSNEYFIKMQKKNNWNLESLIKFHLEQNNVLLLVKEFPYVMYAVRNINGSTRWTNGTFSDELGYYIKYQGEYVKSTYYKNEFEKSGLTIDKFYKKYIFKKKLIIQSSPMHTGSTVLNNALYGLIPELCNKNVVFENYILDEKCKIGIVKTHNTNIDELISKYNDIYDLYFVCSERGNRIINPKYKLYNNVIIFSYDELNESTTNTIPNIIENIYNKINNILNIELNIENGIDRIIKMNELYETIKDKPFTYFNSFFRLHGSHRNRKD